GGEAGCFGQCQQRLTVMLPERREGARPEARPAARLLQLHLEHAVQRRQIRQLQCVALAFERDLPGEVDQRLDELQRLDAIRREVAIPVRIAGRRLSPARAAPTRATGRDLPALAQYAVFVQTQIVIVAGERRAEFRLGSRWARGPLPRKLVRKAGRLVLHGQLRLAGLERQLARLWRGAAGRRRGRVLRGWGGVGGLAG